MSEKKSCGTCVHVNENGEDNKCSPFWKCLMSKGDKVLPFYKPDDELSKSDDNA